MIIGFDPALLARAWSSRHNICVTEPLYSGVTWQFGLQWGREFQRSDRRNEQLVWYFTPQSNRNCVGRRLGPLPSSLWLPQLKRLPSTGVAGGERKGAAVLQEFSLRCPRRRKHLQSLFTKSCWTDMAETLRRLTNTSSFRVLQDKLENWHREYHVSSWISNEQPKSDHGTSLVATAKLCYRLQDLLLFFFFYFFFNPLKWLFG